MRLTTEQEQIIKYAEAGLSFKVFAYAGSGKTSTMIHACKAATQKKSKQNRHTRGLFLAFNKAIAKDAGEELKKSNINTEARTWHSLAINRIRSEYREKLYNLKGADLTLRQHLKNNFYLTDQRIAVKRDILKHQDNDKTPKRLEFRDVSKNTCKGYIIKAINYYFSSTDKELTLQHFKPVCPKWADEESFLNTFVINNLLLETKKLVESIINTEETKFPLSFAAALKIYQLRKPKLHNEFDFLVVDEAQDTDLVALDILNNQDLNRIQIIVVGDSYQQIYSWRGALDALDNVNIEDVLYLSKSFRFGPHIAKFASAILKNYFESFNEYIKGNEDKSSKIYEIQSCTYSNYNAIITRTNAGAFDAFIKTIEQSPNLNIAVDLDVNKLEKYLLDFEKLQKGQKLDSDSDLILFENIEQLEEYVEENPTDSDVSAPYRLIVKVGLDELKSKISKIQQANKRDNSNKKYDLLISTAHKSKGLQFGDIVIFEDFTPFLFKEIDTDEGKINIYEPVSDEEVRLFYVAVTRAINSVSLENFSLIFVEHLVKSTLDGLKSSQIENKDIYLTKQDIDLCHKILIKNQDKFIDTDLNIIFSQHNIYDIIQYFLINKNE